MFRALVWLILPLCFTFAVTVAPPSSAAEQALTAQMPQRHRSALKKYCFECHNTEAQEGNVDLQTLSFELNTLPTAELWQKILNAINEGEMPPQESPQLSDKEKADLLADLSRQLVIARKVLSDSGGKITMRRLNRREYANTIRELLGVNVDVSSLPDDMGSGGFDTTGSALFFSSDQLEKYLALGRAAIDEALHQRWVNRTKKTKRTEGETQQLKAFRNQLKTRKDELRRVKLRRENPDQPASNFGFIDDARMELEENRANKSVPILEAYLNHPMAKSGGLLGIYDRKLTTINNSITFDQPAGRYHIRVRVGAFSNPDLPPQFQDLQLLQRKSPTSNDWDIVGTQRVTATAGDPQVLEFTVDVDATRIGQFQVRIRQHNDNRTATDWIRGQIVKRKQEAFRAAKGEERKALGKKLGVVAVPFLWVDWIEAEGPLEESVPTFRKRFGFPAKVGLPPRQKTRQVLEDFAAAAYRGKQPTERFIDRLMKIIEAKEESDGFDEALRTAMSVILTSPKFLYIIEPAEDEQRRTLNDIELANRLSYFLWSSPPDARLLKLAREEKLSRPWFLKNQTERLLSDDRAIGFVESFVHQWLDMERLDFFQFNVRRYPTFDESLRSSARREIVETFVDAIRNGRSIRELLNSDHVIINDVLARHYDIGGVTGSAFQRVKVPSGNPRGGLLATTAVLAMGSDGERSSPVERGAWVLRHLLNAPPPPAPANVPQLNRNEDPHHPVRVLQKAHQDAPQCAQCHREIDPIGYGMENFAADGRWRTKEVTEKAGGKGKAVSKKEHPIDPSGTLPDGTAFQDFFEMRDSIAEHEDKFAQCLTEALIEYGLGRPYGFSDQDLAEGIIAKAKKSDYSLDAFILALIESPQFRTK